MNADTFHKLMAVRQARLIPTDGLVTYLPMNVTTYKGVPCRSFTTATSISVNNTGSSILNYTFTFWLCPTTAERHMYAFYDGTNKHITVNSGIIQMHSYNPTVDLTATNTLDNWNFVAYTSYDTTKGTKTYGTNRMQVNDTVKSDTQDSARLIGIRLSTSATLSTKLSSLSEYYFEGYMAGFRLYNRALTDDEINALRKEFSPTA